MRNAIAPSLLVALLLLSPLGTGGPPAASAQVAIAFPRDGARPVPDTGGPAAGSVGGVLVLDASGSVEPDGACDDRIVSYSWDLNDDGTFDVQGGSASVEIPWSTISLPELGLSYPTNPESGVPVNPISLRVTDTGGHTGTVGTTLRLYYDVPLPTFDAVPGVAPIDGLSGQAQVTFDASDSTHGHPSRTITDYQWDFDGDSLYDDATGAVVPNVSFSFGRFPPASAVRVIGLRTIDDQGTVATTSIEARFQMSPVPPHADANGPYAITAGQSLLLDGQGSYHPDAASGAYISRAEWDIDDNGSFDFVRVSTGHGQPAALTVTLSWEDLVAYDVIATGGAHPIKLRVTDTGGRYAEDSSSLRIYPTAPTAVARVRPGAAACGQSIVFDHSESYHANPSREMAWYEWDIDTGGPFASIAYRTTNPDASATRVYDTPGTYGYSLTVSDAQGGTHEVTGTVSVVVESFSAAAGGPYEVTEGETITLRGGISGGLCDDTGYVYVWDFDPTDGLTYEDATGPRPTFDPLSYPGIMRGRPVDIGLRVIGPCGTVRDATGELTITAETVRDIAVLSVQGPDSAEVGTPVVMLVEVANLGDVAESFSVTLMDGLTTIGARSVTALAPAATQTLTFFWDTRGATAGDHVLLAPPYIISESEVAQVIDRVSGAIDDAIAEVRS